MADAGHPPGRDLVHVVEERRRLDGRPVARRARPAAIARASHAGHVRHGARVAERPRGRIERAQRRAASRRVGTGMRWIVANAGRRGAGLPGRVAPAVRMRSASRAAPPRSSPRGPSGGRGADGPEPLERRGPGGRSRCRRRPRPARAAAGCTSSSAALVAVALPWWATLRTSIRGRPFASRSGSTSSSASPVSRNRRPFASPSSTIEMSLIPRPVDAGSAGTPAPARSR